MMSNPYRGLPSRQFWKSGVTDVALGTYDPVSATKFKLNASDKISTLGSCFAQHLARHIHASGFNYFLTEPATSEEATDPMKALMANQFSARYGNVYTVRQALQLLERAVNGWSPENSIWERDGRYFDAFRPNVYSEGFSTIEELESNRKHHLGAVKRVFTESDVVVFTLGLTEAWTSKHDLAAYPLAPGVVAGAMDPGMYEFTNYSSPDVHADLESWCVRLRELNPKVRILLTVSPVPLNATYEPQNVWVSTTYSKSVLRAAAGDVAKMLDYVDYFPSYEIIMNPQNQGRYFEDDLREVKEIGVKHVMRVFSSHYLVKTDAKSSSAKYSPSNLRKVLKSKIANVFCDEDLLDQSE